MIRVWLAFAVQPIRKQGGLHADSPSKLCSRGSRSVLSGCDSFFIGLVSWGLSPFPCLPHRNSRQHFLNRQNLLGGPFSAI
jgi:hypothetical protein